MSVLKKYFNHRVKLSSPVQKDYNRVVNYDENGNEFVSYEEVDYSTLVHSQGKVTDWSLNALLSAGINPNFPIHTGLNTRLEGLDVVNQASAFVDSLLSETPEE